MSPNVKLRGPGRMSTQLQETALTLKLPKITGAAGTAGWAVLSRIIINRSFDHSVRPFSAFDDTLDMFNRLRSEELLPGLLAHSCRDIFDNKKLATMFQRIGHFCVYHCLFHFEYPFISPSNPKIDPQLRVRLVQSDNLYKWPAQITGLNVQWSARLRETKN